MSTSGGPAHRLGPAHWVRIAITAGLVWWLVRRTDWAAFGRTVRGIDPLFLGLSLLMTPVLIGLSAWKWQILVRARGDRASFGTCFHLYMVGYFFNNFLPTGVGGDVVRAYLLGRRAGGPARAVASVFVERFTGFTTLVLLVLLTAMVGPAATSDPRLRFVIGIVVVAYALAVWIILDRRVLDGVPGFNRLPFRSKVVKLHEAIAAYRHHARALIACLGLSVLFYAGAAINILFSARAFGADVAAGQVALVTPAIQLVSMLPVSIGGLGVAEVAFLFGLGACGVASATALATALLIRLKGLVVGLAGALAVAATDWPVLWRPAHLRASEQKDASL